MKLNPKWAVAGILGASSLAQACKRNAVEFFRIQTAVAYLKAVEIIRDLFLYQLGILICVMFLVFGVILIEGGAVFFLPLQPVHRASVTLLVGALNFLVSLGFLAYFSSSSRWLRQAEKYHEFLEEFMRETRNSLKKKRR